MGAYDIADKALVEQVVNALSERCRINIKRRKFRPIPAGASLRDDITPTVYLWGWEIKEATGRTQLRESVYEEFQKLFGRFSQISTEMEFDMDNQPYGLIGLSITFFPARAEENTFESLAELKRHNEQDREKQSELAN